MATLGRIFRWGDQRQWNFLNIPVHQQRDFLVLQETKTHILSMAVKFTMPTQKSLGYLQSTREMLTQTDISVDGHAIERMGEIKLLGVQIDEKLKNCRGPSAAKLSLQFCSINLLLSSLALLQCTGSEKAGADSGVSAKSSVQNQISVLSRTARPRQTTDVVVYKTLPRWCLELSTVSYPWIFLTYSI